ncbi:MAG: hypothetical protein J6W56_01780 [Prevotella sp.]|nr:hypothetical protein [Prevotella sp.]
MKEIKINVSPKVWICILLVMIAVFAAIMGISAAIGGPGAIGADKYHMITMFICMTLIILVPAYIKRKTYLVITDAQLRVNAPEPWVVQLSGVDSFYLDKYKGRQFIGIRYKDNIEGGISDEQIAKYREQRSKASLQGYPYEIYVRFLSMKPQEICDLLNARIIN